MAKDRHAPHKAIRLKPATADLLQKLAEMGFRSAPKEVERLILEEAARKGLRAEPTEPAPGQVEPAEGQTAKKRRRKGG